MYKYRIYGNKIEITYQLQHKVSENAAEKYLHAHKKVFHRIRLATTVCLGNIRYFVRIIGISPSIEGFKTLDMSLRADK